ncbi:MAG: YggS family pyridoxal phosphate-dependent enzyme [Anaerolineae bacterium]
MVDIEANLRDVQRRIAEAAGRAGRDPAEITLVAVTKMFTVAHIQAAYELGVRHFGENRVREAEEKIPIVNQWVEEKHTLSPLTWHMVGHLQSRKAKDAIQLFDIIHSVDTLKLAKRLDRLCRREDRIMPILLEANVSGEESKYGFALERWAEDEKQRGRFFAIVEEILALPQVEVQGLMTMAPIVADPEEARPYFRRLRLLRDALAERFPGEYWRHVSMGMTDDFEVAIEEGATIVRIGRAIFGERRV